MKDSNQIDEDFGAFFKRTSKKHRGTYMEIYNILLEARLDIHKQGKKKPFWRPKTVAQIFRASVSGKLRENMKPTISSDYGSLQQAIDRVAEIVGFQKVEKKYPKEYDFEKIKEYKHSPVKYRYVFKKRWWRWLFR